MADIVRMVLGYLWDWIYRTGTTQQEIIKWFQQFDPYEWLRTRRAGIIPDTIITAIAKLLVMTGWDLGTFMIELEQQLVLPPAGYRWKKIDEFGTKILVKEGVATEQPIVKGKRFAGHVFIGIWWTTESPGDPMNQQLQRFIRSHDGAIFWKPSRRRGEMFQSYWAYVIAPDKGAANETALELCSLADAVDSEGGGEHRLSAISMDGIAEHREVRRSDQVFLNCIRSVKLDWEYNLDDLLNGRISRFKNSKAYQNLIQMLREA